MSTWYFVRHGQSVANKDGWLAGHADVALSALGRAQASALTPVIARLSLDRAYSSDLLRAHRTALIAMADHPLEPVPVKRLRERHLGSWEGWSLKELRRINGMAQLLSWEGRPPGGESQRDVARRILTWMAEHEPDQRSVLFVHGGIIRVITGLFDGLAPEDIGKRKIANAQLIRQQITQSEIHALLDSPALRGHDDPYSPAE
jgi:probable phosphoglycerate mutase